MVDIETAAELTEQGRRVTLVCGRTLAPALSAPGRRCIAKWRSRHEVAMLDGVVVSEVRPDVVAFADGTVRASLLTIWAGGFGVPESLLSRIAGTEPAAIEVGFSGAGVASGTSGETRRECRALLDYGKRKGISAYLKSGHD